jgi:hypothetical protein
MSKPFDQFNPWRRQMTNNILTVRFAQALLAVTTTTASVLVFQFAMLVGDSIDCALVAWSGAG